MKITIYAPSILPRSINVLIYSNYNFMRLHKLLLKVKVMALYTLYIHHILIYVFIILILSPYTSLYVLPYFVDSKLREEGQTKPTHKHMLQ